MKSFSVSISSDDVGLWLEQNGVSERDVQKFKGKHVLIAEIICVLLRIYT